MLFPSMLVIVSEHLLPSVQHTSRTSLKAKFRFVRVLITFFFSLHMKMLLSLIIKSNNDSGDEKEKIQ